MPEEDVQHAELPLETVGVRLRNARVAAGLSRGEIATRTKIAERHLASIEEDRFSDLAGKTYAVGFSRAYARAVGLDEKEIARAVREALAADEDFAEKPQPASFEPGDPARVPASRLAWLAALGALAVVALVFVVWRSFYAPAVRLPDLTANQQPEPAAGQVAPPTAAAAATGTPAAQAGPVVFTALAPGVWVKFYDASGKQLMQKQMAQGERYTVPADANGPRLWTARPDALEITVGGRVVPKLADRPVTMKDVPVSAAALLARPASAPSSSPPSAAAGAMPLRPIAARPTAKPTAKSTPSAAPGAQAASAPKPRQNAAPVPQSTASPTHAAGPAPKATPTAPPKPPVSPKPAASPKPAVSPKPTAASRPAPTATQTPATTPMMPAGAPAPTASPVAGQHKSGAQASAAPSHPPAAASRPASTAASGEASTVSQ